MIHRLVLEETVGEDGKLIIQLPPESFHGKVKVTIEVENEVPVSDPNYTAEDEAAFQAEVDAYFGDPNLSKGLGLTAEEIAKSPYVGAWAHRTDITDSVEFVEKMRREKRERNLKGD